MIDALIRWSLRNRTAVMALAAALLAWGGYAISTVPLDVLPDLTAPTVTILVEGRGMAPTEMEPLVTVPIESALNGAPGVRRVRSATAVGIAVIWVEFNWGEDIYRARQVVTEKLNQVGSSLPPKVSQPYLAPMSSIMGEIMFIDLESDRHSPLELRTVADTVIRRRLLAVPGVSQVVPFPWNLGIPIVKEYQTVMTTETGKSDYSFLTLESYLSARILVEGLRRAGRDLTREKLIAALETIHDEDFGGFRVNFSRTDHAASKFVELTVIGKDGQILR